MAIFYSLGNNEKKKSSVFGTAAIKKNVFYPWYIKSISIESIVIHVADTFLLLVCVCGGICIHVCTHASRVKT